MIYIARDAAGRPMEASIAEPEATRAAAWGGKGWTWHAEPASAWVEPPAPVTQSTLFGGG